MAISKRNMSIMIMAFVTVFLDTMNYALIVPILPTLVKELDSSSILEGILFSSYSIFQLISLLIAGPLSDKYGRKPFLLLSLFGSCVGSILQGLSRTMLELIIWRSFTGLFAGSLILVQAVVADVTDTVDRNTWLSRLDGIVSTAFIVGPAIGAVLLRINSRFPLYFAGVVSGLAMLVAFFFLKESHPRVVNKSVVKKEEKEIKEEKKEVKEEKVKPRLTPLMLYCFVFEFCNRWIVNAFDSRYGFYLIDKFNLPSHHYSILVVLSSAICCVLQLFTYPWVVSTLGIPIPYLAAVGLFVEIFSYIGMSAINNVYGSMICSLILWCGFCFASPASVSIISTSTSPAIQGTVLSWNNFCSQASLIISPLVLSTIYAWNIDATYYLSSILSVIGFLIMGYMSTWKNAKSLGRPQVEPEKSVEEQKVEIEMKSVNPISNESEDNETKEETAGTPTLVNDAAEKRATI